MRDVAFASVESLDQWLSDRNMSGLWSMRRGGGGGECVPSIWKWGDIYHGLMNAAQLVPMEKVAMRVLQLKNPGLQGGMSNTLQLTVQCLMPGERTRAHRNLVNETRFVLKAPPGAVFIIDGEPFPMEAGDLVTTPNWSWHDHYNGGDEPAIWVDGLDRPLVTALGKAIDEPLAQPQQAITRPVGYSSGALARARPRTPRGQPAAAFRYPWQETYATLMALRDSEAGNDPFDGVLLTYTNPRNGGPAVSTYACELQLLSPRLETKAHRHNSTTLYHVYRGSGVTVVDDTQLEWAEGDIFVVPPWSWHSHANQSDADAILYSITDWPTMASLGLYREEPAD